MNITSHNTEEVSEKTDEEQQENNEETSDSNVKLVCNSKKVTTSVSLLIESLVKSLCTMIEPDKKRSLKIYSLICDKLFQMKLIDESYNMKEFEGMRSQYETALIHLMTAARSSDQPLAMPIWPVNNDLSHYNREFEEQEYIAGGGFGQVFKVKHKLDGTEYAVKKIFIRSEGIKSVMKYLSEVKTFASLNHPNIVQYKAAWLELGAVNTLNYIDAIEASEASVDCSKDVSNSADAPNKDPNMAVYEYKVVPKWATLFIQMTLCKQTLKQWLDEKRLVTKDTHMVMDILRQILGGLSYIHSKRIVHHDIKPSNIFIQIEEETKSLTVQLGDFGLACPLQNDKHSLAFGTRMYAAPEQLKGKCDPKSDLYSLGIVLLELAASYNTDMERVMNISNLHKGKLPESIPASLGPLIRQLTARKPEDRPNASDLLKMISLDDTKRIKQLEVALAEKDKEIQRLTELLQSHGIKH